MALPHSMLHGVAAAAACLDRMATAAERQADATVANNVQQLVMLDRLAGISGHLLRIMNRLESLDNNLHDIRDCYGKLITLQTSGVPPWHYRDQGFNVVEFPKRKAAAGVATVRYGCESFTGGERCDLAAGHTGPHLIGKPEPLHKCTSFADGGRCTLPAGHSGEHQADAGPILRPRCELFTHGGRCVLFVGHSGEHQAAKPEPPPIEMRNAPGAGPKP